MKTKKYVDERIGHYSMQAKASASQVAEYVKTCVKIDKVVAFAGTECRGVEKRNAIKKALGWRWVVRNRGEFVFAWRRDKFGQRGDVVLRTLSDVYSDVGEEWWKDFFAAFVPMAHKPTKSKFNWSVGHAPATIEGKGGRFRGRWPKQEAAWDNGFAKWGNHLRAAMNRGIDVLAQYDGNANQRNFVWRKRVASLLQTPSALKNKKVNWGTHRGARLIDAFNTSLHVVKVQRSKMHELKKTKAGKKFLIFDHTGTVLTARFFK